MIEVGGRVGHGQVVEDHVAVAGEPIQEAGGVALPLGAALPGAGLFGGAEPQPPADQGRDRQAEQADLLQAGLGGEHLAEEAGGGDQRPPPGQAAGPAGQLKRAAAPVLAKGGTPGAAVAAGDRLGRHWHGRGWRGPGTPEGVPWWVEGGPAAAQQPGGLAGVGVQEPLELLAGQGTDRQAGALIDRAAELVVQVLAVEVLVVEVVGVLVHLLLPSAC